MSVIRPDRHASISTVKRSRSSTPGWQARHKSDNADFHEIAFTEAIFCKCSSWFSRVILRMCCPCYRICLMHEMTQNLQRHAMPVSSPCLPKAVYNYCNTFMFRESSTRACLPLAHCPDVVDSDDLIQGQGLTIN
jgi:hypothetical protein